MDEFLRRSLTLDTAFSDDKSVACVRVAGDADSNSWQALADHHLMLTRAGSSRIYFDLAETTFIGITLMAFFSRLTETGAAVTLCRPTDQTDRIILAIDVIELFGVTDELPPDWVDPMVRELSDR